MEKTLLLRSYEINMSTMALLPFYNEYGDVHTEVLESEKNERVALSPIKIINESCLFFGSSYEGRREAVRRSMGYVSLSPIMINLELGIFFFPVESPKNETCIWLSQAHVQRIDSIDSDTCSVHFKNTANLILPQSKYALEAKLFRTAQYRYILSERVSERIMRY
ncbi:competence protein ComK [Fictibacillus barbaricus]|uniref:Competence protein ComK n=1 Tax=Fictibacillus barbaricus TaxID=182136 RepID=A0ABS2ZAK9_9BACL|nr:competence protein ComK [Fictibacillus barbaricus]MBN3545212.1 competence protein ComK [Fictibacillus barbaricus]GGB60757.1 competence transcription factor [Fictibacillus barbaricus]